MGFYRAKKGWIEGYYNVRQAAERYEHFAASRQIRSYEEEYAGKSERENRLEKNEKMGLIRRQGKEARFSEGKPLFRERSEFRGELNEGESEEEVGLRDQEGN